MNTRAPLTVAGAAALAIASAATAQVTMPNEFAEAAETIDRLYAYFGGVQSFAVSHSSEAVYTGGSCRVDIAFRPDGFFPVSGVALGTLGIAAPDLHVDPAADTFSLTVRGPESGGMSVTVVVREDDDNDGLIDVENSDDEWEAGTVVVPARAVTTINIPATSFQLANAGVGNGVRQFTTTARMAYILKFETRQSLPGGRIVTPVSIAIDHVGLYAGPQSAPTGPAADLNGDGFVDSIDLGVLLGAWGPCGACNADITGDGLVDSQDLAAMLGGWGPA